MTFRLIWRWFLFSSFTLILLTSGQVAVASTSSGDVCSQGIARNIDLGVLPMQSVSQQSPPPPTPDPNPTPIIVPTVVSTQVAAPTGDQQAEAFQDLPPGGRAAPETVVEDLPEPQQTLCNNWNWWYLPLLIAILVFLLAIYFLVTKRWFAAPQCNWRCRLFRLLFMLWFPVIGYIAGNLFGGTCQTSGILIWRVDNTRSADIVSIGADTESVPYEVGGLDTNNQCVGCHTYNDRTQRLVYTIGGMTGPLVLFDRETGTETPLLDENGNPLHSSYTDISPNGDLLALALNDGDIYVYDFDEQTLQAVAANSDYVETMPHWIDNDDIVFVRSEVPAQPNPILTEPTDLYRINLRTLVEEPVASAAEPGVFEYYPAASPDGLWLAFTRHENKTTYADDESEIWLINQLVAGERPQGVESAASWPVWLRDGDWLVFRTTSQDAASDIFMVGVSDSGLTGERFALQGASQPGVMEHLPSGWDQGPTLNMVDFLKQIAFWLLPLFPLYLLAVSFCPPMEGVQESERVNIFNGSERMALPSVEPLPITPAAVWETTPALVIGFGRAGRWTLTHLKKTLKDAGLGDLPKDIPLLCIAAGDYARINQPGAPGSFEFGGVELGENELYEWRDNLQPLVQHSRSDSALSSWLDSDYLTALGNAGQDPRQGLNNQRILGRLAVIHDMRKETPNGEKHPLWNRLIEAGKAATPHDRKHLHVILVADTADDVGSGGLFDVTALCRKLKDDLELSTVRIVVHLMTDQVGGTSPHRQANTTALARELARFQIGNVYEFPMYYGDGTFDTTINTKMFDEIYFYDGRIPPLDRTPPEYGLYPMISDSIALSLDEGASTLHSIRQAMIGQVEQQQQYTQQLVVGSQGIYQYRIPVVDLLEVITTEYALSALRLFLTASDQDEKRWQGNPRMDYAREFYGDQASGDDLVRDFLKGDLGEPADISMPMWKLLQALSEESSQTNYKQLVSDIKKRKDDLNAWKRWVSKVLLLLLNGEFNAQEQQPNYLIKRGAKLGVAYDFLKTLAGEGDYKGKMGSYQQLILASGAKNAEQVSEAFGRFITHTQQIFQALDKLAVSLGFRNGRDSLHRILMQRRGSLDKRRKDLEKLVTRQYLWEYHGSDPIRSEGDRSLQKRWYEPLRQRIDVIISQLEWSFNENYEPMLILKRPRQQQNLIHDPANPDEFATAMIAVGYSIAKDVWQRDSIMNILPQNADSQYPNLNMRTWMNLSQPNLDVERQSHMLPLYMLAGKLEKSVRSAMQNAMAQYINNTQQLKSLDSTDAHTLSLMQSIDGIAWYQTRNFRDALEYYMQETGLSGNVYDPATAIPPSIFAAEKNALHYERRLPQIHEPVRLFTPLVVALLNDPDSLQAYLLAFASGQLIREDERKGSIHLDIPQKQVTLLDEPTSERGALLDAFLQFRKAVSPEMVKTLLEHMDEEEDRYLTAWEEWFHGGWSDWLPSATSKPQAHAITKDLIDISRIMIDEIL